MFSTAQFLFRQVEYGPVSILSVELQFSFHLTWFSKAYLLFSLVEYSLVSVPPSLLAAASLALAMRLLEPGKGVHKKIIQL